MTAAAADRVRTGRASRATLFIVVAALTAGELGLAASGADGQLRLTALCGLLLLKASLLLAFGLRATPRRPAPRLTLLALVAACGFTVVLMLEAAYRAGVK